SSLSLTPSHSLRFFFECSGDPRDLHSFPTRRSSDLKAARALLSPGGKLTVLTVIEAIPSYISQYLPQDQQDRNVAETKDQMAARSEEHTSELQSRENLVCRLLLEKKKTKERTIQEHD